MKGNITKDHILYDSVHMKQNKQINRDTDQWFLGAKEDSGKWGIN